MRLYYKYSEYLKEKYGVKVYKLPVNLQVTCPNKDGKLSRESCIYCSACGAGFESLPSSICIREQLKRNKTYIKKKYKAERFIAYFQNYTNTYMPLSQFKLAMEEALIDDIVEIAISTRPDCIHDDYLTFLQKLAHKHHVHVTIELGLQTANYHTLYKINRGHGLAEYIDACQRIKKYGLSLCTHVILNLPWDNKRDVVETSKLVSVLNNDQIKIHSLYIAKNTPLAKMYLDKEFELSKDDYISSVIVFLEYLNPHIAVQRLLSRAPEEETIFCNWNTSWWKLRDEIEARMIEGQSYQGKRYDYQNGKAVHDLANQ